MTKRRIIEILDKDGRPSGKIKREYEVLCLYLFMTNSWPIEGISLPKIPADYKKIAEIAEVSESTVKRIIKKHKNK